MSKANTHSDTHYKSALPEDKSVCIPVIKWLAFSRLK